jgi:hypothetical protein
MGLLILCTQIERLQMEKLVHKRQKISIDASYVQHTLYIVCVCFVWWELRMRKASCWSYKCCPHHSFIKSFLL